jgi:uncharacterized protein (UPF0333 family)
MKKDNKAQVQLGLFLSLIVMLFVIGLIVMIFTIMGNELRDASYTSTTVSFDNYTTSAVMNYTVVSTNAVTVSGVTSTLRNCQMTITAI